MGIYRTYFDKNNTIVKNSYVNTGKNPVSELFYGNLISRFLFYCSFDEIKQKYINKEFDLNTTNHYLKIKNSSNFDVSQLLSTYNDILFSNKYRATSFDLELKPITESWDEGTGYDFEVNILNAPHDSPYRTQPSNWFQRTTTSGFTQAGGTLSTAIATQHFDNGDEDVMMDITTYVNNILTGATNNGLCLKFSDEYENFKFPDGNTRALGLFTKYTQTFFEPFIETVFNDTIKDDRVNFYLNKINRLYLYVNIDGRTTNLDTLPTCTINGSGMTVNQQTTGVYYAIVPATGDTFDSYVKYNDVWSNIIVNGINRPNIRLSFIPKEDGDYYQIGSNTIEPVNYGISISGIKQGEKVTQGEIRKVYVHLRKPYTVEQYDVLTNIYYNLYIKQGANQIQVLDWQPVDITYNTNVFTVDTSWLVPQIYYTDIKVERNGGVYLYNEELKFSVPSKISQ